MNRVLSALLPIGLLLLLACSRDGDSKLLNMPLPAPTGQLQCTYFSLTHTLLDDICVTNTTSPYRFNRCLESVRFGTSEIYFIGFTGTFTSYSNSTHIAQRSDAHGLFYDVYLFRTNSAIQMLFLTPQEVQIPLSDLGILVEQHPELFITAEHGVIYVESELYSNSIPELSGLGHHLQHIQWHNGNAVRELATTADRGAEIK